MLFFQRRSITFGAIQLKDEATSSFVNEAFPQISGQSAKEKGLPLIPRPRHQLMENEPLWPRPSQRQTSAIQRSRHFPMHYASIPIEKLHEGILVKYPHIPSVQFFQT